MVYKQSGRTVKFLELATKVKYEVQKEIDVHKNGKDKEGNINQLKRIMDEVEIMTTTLSPKKYTPTYPRMIIDSWDFNSNLAILLLDFHERFCKLE